MFFQTIAPKSVTVRPLKDSRQDIYTQYVDYCNDINAKIHNIDLLPESKRNAANVQNDRQYLVSSIGMITPFYQADYASKTLAQFQADCQSIINMVLEKYNDAMGSTNPNASQIQGDYQQALATTTQINTDLGTVSSILASGPTFSSSLQALQSQIDLMLPGDQKTKAQNDLDQAKALFQVLSLGLESAQTPFKSLIEQVNLITETNGLLDQLKALSQLLNPSSENVQTADQLLGTVNSIKALDNDFQTQTMSSINTQISDLKILMQTVQNDITPQPANGKIENACWYIDWTSWDFPVPQGVNMVNIFVGKLDASNGEYTVDGFGNMNLAQLKQFVDSCAAKGIDCKVSIGGGGGSYDKCWDALTPTTVNLFAQGLADFCAQNGLKGIDFDYEENGTDAQKTLVGTLIKNLKQINPDLQTSLCTNASFAGWSKGVKTIMDATVDNGKSMLDRLYVMSYYDPLSSEQGWLTQWANWLKSTYQFDASQLTVGIDDFDAHAYNIADIASWAAQQE